MDKLLRISRKESVVKKGLLLSGQVAYNLGLNEIIGPQNKVAYNAMGPDLSTVLYLTDPENIVGIDKESISKAEMNYLFNELGEGDVSPISSPIYSYSHHFFADKMYPRFQEDLEHRREKGYWDQGDLNRWRVNQLFLIELEKLGIKEIEINEKEKNYHEVKFAWKHPLGGLRERKIHYFQSKLSELDLTHIKGTSVYYQKSLPDWGPTIPSLKKIFPHLKDNSSVFIGYWHDEYPSQNNLELSKNILDVLGKKFSKINIEEELSNLLNFDEESMGYYGNRLHSFKKI